MARYATLAAVLAGLLAGELWAQEEPPPPTPVQRDTVRKADGKILANVMVLSETPSEVKIDTRGGDKADLTLDQNEVTSIQYSGAPAPYLQGVAFYRVRQYDKATAQFREAMQTPGVRKWVKDYSTYYLAMCLVRQAEGVPAERAKAVAALTDLLKDPGNRWRDDARYQLGQMYLDAADKSRALGAFTDLESSAHRDEMKLTASVGMGAILMADGKPADALERYDKVVTGAKGRFNDLYVTAMVGKAEALTALKRFDEAASFIETVLKSATSDELLAKAHLALGDCCFAQATAEKDEKQARQRYKTALKSYLWDIVVFYNQKAEYAKALLYAGRCWEKLGDVPRAQELYRELQNKFGTTRWAAMVKG
jgi:tetratricopeptide (TPR) repeat protein